MERILVLGSSGSGKTTVARQLGDSLSLEVIHLDSYYWRPNWVATPAEEWQEQLNQLLRRDTWVMDGNYIGSLAHRLNFADSVVFLDLSRAVCLWRCGKRLVQNRGRNRAELAPGCYEKMDWDFFRWIWDFPRDIRPEIVELLEKQPASTAIFRLQSSLEITKFLATVAGN